MQEFIDNISNGSLQGVTTALDANPQYVDLLTVYYEQRRPIHYAAWGGHVDILELLLNRGSRSIMTPDTYGSLPIHFAAQSGSIPCVNAILNRVDVPIADLMMIPGSSQYTPMMFAFQSGNLELIAYLRQLHPAAYDTITHDCPMVAMIPDGPPLQKIFETLLHIWEPENVRLFGFPYFTYGNPKTFAFSWPRGSMYRFNPHLSMGLQHWSQPC